MLNRIDWLAIAATLAAVAAVVCGALDRLALTLGLGVFALTCALLRPRA